MSIQNGQSPAEKVLPAEDIWRTIGAYYMRVSAFQNQQEIFVSEKSQSISFTMKLMHSKPSWNPNNPGNGLVNLDVIAFSLLFAISFIFSLVMIVLIIRARRRLYQLQNWQFRPQEYSPEIAMYQPGLFSVVMSVPSRIRLRLNQKMKSKTSLGDREFIGRTDPIEFSDKPQEGGWFGAIPRILRKITSSVSNLDLGGNTKSKWVNQV